MYIRLKLKNLTAVICTLLFITSYTMVSVYAHIFTTNESASFISLVDQIDSTLIAMSLDNSTNNNGAVIEQAKYARMLLNESVVHELEERNERISSNLVSALDSVQNASRQQLNTNVDMISDILSEAISARIESDHLVNVTIQAIVVAENVDKIFDEYNTAFEDNANSANKNTNMTTNKSSTNITSNKSINNENAYRRAAALTDITIKRFNSELKDKSISPSSMQEALNGLTQMKTSIENKVPSSDLLGIIHGQIHPNLQKAFGLQLANSTNSTSNSTTMSMS